MTHDTLTPNMTLTMIRKRRAPSGQFMFEAELADSDGQYVVPLNVDSVFGYSGFQMSVLAWTGKLYRVPEVEKTFATCDSPLASWPRWLDMVEVALAAGKETT